MKSITYRGGLVTFRIPRHWVEEYEEDGGGTFYEDRPDSGTLRLNVLTFTGPVGSPAKSPLAVLQGSSKAASGTMCALPNGNALLTGMDAATDGSTPIHMYYWHIAQHLPPSHYRLALFTYTVEAGRDTGPPIVHELEILNAELPRAVMAPVLGVLADDQ